MRNVDYSPRAAAITDELIRLSEGSFEPGDRDPVRAVIRIAFEVQALLSSTPDDLKGREWTQETVCAGCESSLLARDAWRELGQFDGLSLPGAGFDTFPVDMSDLSEQLNLALRTVEDGARLSCRGVRGPRPRVRFLNIHIMVSNSSMSVAAMEGMRVLEASGYERSKYSDCVTKILRSVPLAVRQCERVFLMFAGHRLHDG